MSQPQPQQPPQAGSTTAKFQLHSTLSSSLDDPPSPTHTTTSTTSSSNHNSQQSRNEKYHKSIKKSINKMAFTTPNYSDSDIFERTCQSHGVLNSKRTPSHYNLENYTSPILDTITNNPLNAVTLNCFCEDNDPQERDHDNYNNGQIDDDDDDDDDEDDEEYRLKAYTGPPQDHTEHIDNEESLTPPFIRPRARSIISQSLISTLNHKNNNNNSTTPNHHHHLSQGGSGGIHPSASSTGVPTLAFPPLAKRLKSYAGQTPISKNKGDSNTNNNKHTNSIDFYSFADMNQMENEHEPYATTTISAKDYIGRF